MEQPQNDSHNAPDAPTATLTAKPPQDTPKQNWGPKQRVTKYAGPGRPPVYPNNLDQLVYSLALAGYTDEGIAEALGFSKPHFSRLKRSRLDIKNNLERARLDAQTKVAKSLYERALGVEVYEERLNRDGEPVKCKKLLPGDVEAMQTFLYNRDSGHWRPQGQGLQVNTQINLEVPDAMWRAVREAKLASQAGPAQIGPAVDTAQSTAIDTTTGSADTKPTS